MGHIDTDMMRVGWILLLLFVLVLAMTNRSYGFQTGTHEHGEHSRVGMHGMVMITDGVELYASHLPLYSAPHDYQIIYRVETKYKTQVIERLTRARLEPSFSNNMVTLLPAVFDLNDLINAGSFEISTKLFLGHFERGGKLWLEDQNLKFVRQVYIRSLANLKVADQGEINWNALNMTPKQARNIYVYNIQSPPSFDAIVLADSCPAQNSKLSLTHGVVATVEQLKEAFAICQSSQILYLETRDFVK